MVSRKILPFLLSLGLALIPQISVGQTVEELEKKATSAEEVKNYQEAANIWRSFIERDAKNSYAYVKLADVLSNQGKIAEAIATYRQALELTPDAAIYLKLGSFLAEKGQITEAIAAIRQAIKLDAESDAAYTILAMNLIGVGSPQEAIVAYRQAVKIKPDDDNYNNLADTLFKIGKREEAIAAYREALKINPKSYQAYNSLGDILGYSEAVAIYRQASKNDPKNEVYYEKLAELSLKRGFVNEAIAAYRQLVKIEPEASRYVELGDVLMTQEKHQDAIALYRQAVAKKPNDYYYSKLNQALAKQGNLDEAMANCQKVLKIGEGSYDTCSNISLPLYKQKGLTAVMAFYQPLKNVIPPRQMAELYIQLGRDVAYGESGDGSKQEAAAVFREALQIDPENSDAQDALKNLIAE